VEDLDDLVTYTDAGERGKQVVICRPEQVPAAYRDPEVHGTAPTVDPAPAATPAEAAAPALEVDENEPTIGELLAAEEAAEKAAAEAAAQVAEVEVEAEADDEDEPDVDVEIVEMAAEANDESELPADEDSEPRTDG